jgi:hypothetical protein
MARIRMAVPEPAAPAPPDLRTDDPNGVTPEQKNRFLDTLAEHSNWQASLKASEIKPFTFAKLLKADPAFVAALDDVVACLSLGKLIDAGIMNGDVQALKELGRVTNRDKFAQAPIPAPPAAIINILNQTNVRSKEDIDRLSTEELGELVSTAKSLHAPKS